MTRSLRSIVALLLAAAPGRAAQAEFTTFFDKTEWEAAVGDFTTIDFTGFPNGTDLSDQYADLGVVFRSFNEFVFSPTSFPNDQWGIDGNTAIDMTFASDIFSISIDYPGVVQFELFRDGQSIYTSLLFGGGVGNFTGIIATEPFDRAVIIDPLDLNVRIDDLHFGPPIPAPSALAALALAAAFHRRRRRA